MSHLKLNQGRRRHSILSRTGGTSFGGGWWHRRWTRCWRRPRRGRATHTDAGGCARSLHPFMENLFVCDHGWISARADHVLHPARTQSYNPIPRIGQEPVPDDSLREPLRNRLLHMSVLERSRHRSLTTPCCRSQILLTQRKPIHQRNGSFRGMHRRSHA
ncbi:hypothetical protein BD311DRAFT_255202 [Dichomitus squalens]|uniref:Uncharacterized protein n=1 Tax=Dichomitus squalens TaxID=114155 RepID=A0A4Q9MQ11_9APHY|nr:hypothetical protein BD311DRAFT_255202 [Dichomitus squalens]